MASASTASLLIQIAFAGVAENSSGFGVVEARAPHEPVPR